MQTIIIATENNHRRNSVEIHKIQRFINFKIIKKYIYKNYLYKIIHSKKK